MRHVGRAQRGDQRLRLGKQGDFGCICIILSLSGITGRWPPPS